jgi:cyclopropane fatty-acyl-phospholipid synthase-like methyltransferase
MTEQRNFDWDNVYKSMKITEMPWYSPDLDEDLKNALDKLGLTSGTFLDIVTGPATQANKLAERGFEVTGTDISEDAILLAKQAYNTIEFIHDDILRTKLTKKFDFIFDRGCFHVIAEDKREFYANTVFNLLNASGLLFLKCFSDQMPETGFGPHRISEKIIRETFEGKFFINEIKDTEFKDNAPRTPKALFVVMKRRLKGEE